MRARRLEPFGWEIAGVDLRDRLSDAEVAEIAGLLHGDGFVLFRGQAIDDAQQIAFARRFGLLSGHNPEDRERLVPAEGEQPLLQQLTNKEGVGAANELFFHSDNAHYEFSIRYLMLYGLNVTTDGRPLDGGETMLASAATALERLPEDVHHEMATRECHLSAIERTSFVRPCIERHWATDRPYLIPSYLTDYVLGLEPERSTELQDRVKAIMYDPAFTYRHAWREGDLLFWDNRLVHHARAWFDNAQNRVLRRCAIADEFEPEALAL
jgi:alpha-ketoglutarate-dependent taurine dioxygenase